MKRFRVAALLALGVAASAVPLAVHAESGLDERGHLKPVVPAGGGHFSHRRLDHGVQIRVGDVYRNVIFHGQGTVRVSSHLGESHWLHPSLTVTAAPSAPSLTVTESGDVLTVRAPTLVIEVNKASGALAFSRLDGTAILAERADAPVSLKPVTISDAPTYEATQRFTLKPRESLYGLGQYIRRYMDYRGTRVNLVQSNIGICIPFLLSTERYGLMWDVYSKSTFQDQDGDMSFWAESAPGGADYYFFAGATMDDVIVAYRRLTGAAPMFSKKAFGLWMSKERYPTQDRVLEVARNFRSAGFPIDNIVQDWQYWGGARDGTWSGMIWDPRRFPDPAGMARTLHEDLHMDLMCSIWPSVGHDTELARELDQYGLRHEPLHWISRKARIYDAYSEKGREIYFKHIKKGLLDIGVDALWMDGTEVEVGHACKDEAGTESEIKRLGRNAMGDYTRYLNTYSLVTTKGVYEGQRASGNKRVFTLTRSAWTGQQRYGALSWSGDTWASYDTLVDQVAGGLNVSMSGQPYWTQDTGGFFVRHHGGERNPAYRELFARWNQFGIFNPIYRIHGTSIEREPYIFKDMDPEVYQSLLDAAHLRYRLLPYIYALAWQSTRGYTMMRGMPMDFPDDPNARRLQTQFMFGPAFLVRVVDRPIFRVPGEIRRNNVPGGLLQTPDGQEGVAVRYYRGRDFQTFASARVEPDIDQTWPGPPLVDLPDGIDAPNDFSARWETVLTIPEAGEYELGAVSDDGVRVWVDDVMAIDAWRIQEPTYHGRKFTFAKTSGCECAWTISRAAAPGPCGLCGKRPRTATQRRSSMTGWTPTCLKAAGMISGRGNRWPADGVSSVPVH
jgi:alpha-D-xyloside xylohydrolase